MRVETKVMDGDMRSVSSFGLVRKIKAIGHLEKLKKEARGYKVIDTTIETIDGKEQRITTMYRTKDGKCFLEINGKPKVYAESVSACAARALELKYYDRKDYNRVIRKKVV